jgi:hypothetical protein
LARVDGTAAERACLDKLRELSGETEGSMERHCARVLAIAVELGRRRGLELDRELLGCAAWLHDAGLYEGAASAAAYVTDGRRLVAEVLAPFSWPAERLRVCGDAVERHHALRAQWKLGPEVELLRRADLVDVSAGVVSYGLERSWLKDLFARVPRDGFFRGLLPLLGRTLRDRPLSAPRIFAPPRRG